MRTRFIHFADCHLGYRQYHSIERFNDFARAFLAVIDAAVQEKVDFVILAGDLFEKRSIDALTLNQAMRGLERLRAANIPCLAVEGNHEHAYYGEALGWMRFLAVRDLLVLLDPEVKDGKPSLLAYHQRRGSYIEPVPGLRVHGLRYFGASTAKLLENYAAELAALPADGIDYSIFVTHAGVEGVVNEEAGGLTHSQLAPLRPHADYVALGHVHKPFAIDGWVHNPGSLETCSIMEASWPERGYYLVTVDTDRPRQPDEPKHQTKLVALSRRPFVRLKLGVDHFASPDALCVGCQEIVQRKARDLGSGGEQPVVELVLSGVLPFDRAALDMGRIEALVHAAFSPLVALVKNATNAAEYGVEGGETVTRAALEHEILADLFGRDVRYRAHSQAWANAAIELKRLALDGVAPDAIVDELESRMAAMALMPPEDDLAATDAMHGHNAKE